ncbi:MAG: Phosphatidylserine/phosphatidylglycerophosphate/cardiolipin synthase family protein [Rhodobacteraceae bacterium HLUCCA12]|nr:MAG: Phosphatidylserine/phosphatidylglycerophosphate/cardiolipin synthase family protein [Rhodobacteraceae bacterium HLUCCA12]
MIDWLIWIAGLGVLLVLGTALALWSYGRFARRALGVPSQAIGPGTDAPLDRAIAPLEEAHPEQTGAMFVFDAHEAFALRERITRMARRSIDVQYYIWSDDMTGRLLALALLDAADRGVRVRMLLDDVNVLGRDPLYLALDRHPRVSVRLFNPIRTRERSMRRGVELFFNLLRYNRRMHGKAWIADGRLAVVGGRNVGDVDFGAAAGRKRNNDDLDMLLAGPAVLRAAEIFDAFWNARLALPIRALWQKRRTSLSRLRARLARDGHGEVVREFRDRVAIALRARGWPRAEGDEGDEGDETRQLPLGALRWSARTRLVADPPDKALGSGQGDWLPDALMPLLERAQHSLRLMTPYLVPGSGGMATLSRLAGRGVRVEIVTNALAVNDHVVVHGAYRWYRKGLLATGVRLFEFAARRGHGPWPARPRPMLHGKALIVDGKIGFAGSFNFDLRSRFLNTEMGVIFDETALLAELDDRFDRSVAPDRAFALALADKRVSWRRGDEPPTDIEPDSTPTRRLVSFIVGHLPIHNWL